jgi:hypothetical protein
MLQIIKNGGWNALPILLDDLCKDQADEVSEGDVHQF